MAPRKKDEKENLIDINCIDKNEREQPIVEIKDEKEKININEPRIKIYDIILNFLKLIGKIILNFIIGTFKIFIVYFGWIVMHYTASHMYTKLCVPETWYGFFISPFLTSTPHCQGLRWIVYNGANTINSMWVLIGTWLCSKILFTTQNENLSA